MTPKNKSPGAIEGASGANGDQLGGDHDQNIKPTDNPQDSSSHEQSSLRVAAMGNSSLRPLAPAHDGGFGLAGEAEEMTRLERAIVGFQLREVQGADLFREAMAVLGGDGIAFTEPMATIQQAISKALSLGLPTGSAAIASELGWDQLGEIGLKELAASAPVSMGLAGLRRNIDSTYRAWLIRRRRIDIASKAAQVADCIAAGQAVPSDLIACMARDDAAMAAPTDGGQAERFKFTRFPDIQVSTACTYVVKGLIPKNALTVVWGPPKCGKSFVSLDVAIHIALGWNYRGHRVVQGPVVYIALEGAGGYGARIEAFRREHNLQPGDSPDFHLLPTRLDLVADCAELIGAIRALFNGNAPVLIVIDTLNRSLVGSESSDEDMGAYIKATDAIKAAFECAVLVVHHCGINDSRPRGHTSLTGAADAQLAIKRDGSGTILVTLEWLKDGQEGEILASKLKIVEMGIDDDGDPITSCVVQAALTVDTPRPKTTRKLSPKQTSAINNLQGLIGSVSEPVPASFNLPAGVAAVKVEAWKQDLLRCGIIDRDAANPRADFRHLKDALQARQIIAIRDDLVWLVQVQA